MVKNLLIGLAAVAAFLVALVIVAIFDAWCFDNDHLLLFFAGNLVLFLKPIMLLGQKIREDLSAESTETKETK